MRLITTSLLISLLSTSVFAKDLTHRLGVGFKNNMSQNLPSVAAIYYPSTDVALTGGFGVDTRKDHSAFQVNAGGRYIIYPEKNMNFYIGTQIGVISYDQTEVDSSGASSVKKQNGLEASGIFGTEFFLSGLENLGFTFEAGLALSTADSSRFRTVGDDPFKAGLIFYF